jgi:hypothetical protein
VTCPNCAKEIADQATRCEHCGAAVTAVAAREDEDKGKTGGMLKAAGGTLLLVGALMFMSATAYGGGGTAGLAIVLFVAGLVTFFAGRVHVEAR